MTQTRNPSQWRFVLATDLDGTFLGGTEEMRRRLYDWIEERREDVGLIFVTGRDPDFITEMCRAGRAPWPDFVVGDVGTTIAGVEGEGIAPIDDLEAHIREAWGDRSDMVREVLQGAPGLKEQDTPFRHRVSYHWDPETYDPSSVAALEEAGFDILISHGCYLDVLPGGVSKGPSLLRLLEQLGIDREKVLVAGDTLNDLSMFQTGLHGAVVGESEQGLLDATRDLPRSRHCTAPGTGGIAEAIRAFGLHPTPPEEAAA
ncbi:HAD-IIB family hydrolase [Falsirhodobacter algicola]|uniref:HAD-IIB family hydrolase n=1 Tax=Falsirhodobacter algicola TaxID=2692330 RepID=A0A8J8MUT1_9RHOB|nr:HAD-IIB family hydrolase [Falsirhodobacter algicola]QUS37070.1 HAD-IIB family hydrolase [Falsirhodobacter algicola]